MKRIKRKGNIQVIACMLVIVLCGFAAYVIDIGLVFSERIKLSNATDAAALAAILELPESEDRARAAAMEYMRKNDDGADSVIINIGDNNRSIEIQGFKGVKHFFAPIIGIKNSKVVFSTKAILGPAGSVRGGVRPFAVETFDYTYGSLVTLKEGAGDGYKGNYRAVALGGQGANIFKSNALYGYKGVVSAGDFIDTEPGNISGVTNNIKTYINSENSSFDKFSRNSIRLWTIPLVNSLEVNGRGQLQVAGFGMFYVEDVTQKSGKIELIGRFVRYVTGAEINANLKDTGVYGRKLSR